MRKILLVFLTVISLAACKKEVVDSSQKPEGRTVAVSGDENTEEDNKNAGGTCATTFVLNKSQTLPSGWRIENAGRICEETIDKIFVDISTLSPTAKSVWLQKYKQNINFDESARHIEGSHKLHIPTQNTFSDTPLTVNQINTLLAQSTTVETDKYDKYIIANVSNGNITFSVNTQFRQETDRAYFSVPLFRSIMRINSGRINENPIFLFTQGPNNNIFFRVLKLNGNINNVNDYLYYNFSDDPGKKKGFNSPV